MTFFKDLKFGQKYEEELIKLLQDETITKDWKDFKIRNITRSIGNVKEWDIKVETEDERAIYYEVKSDRLGHKTGNLAIEFESNKKPSCLQATTSDYWAYFLILPDKSYELYVFKLEDLKRIIKEKNCRWTTCKDKMKNKIYLLPKREVIDYLQNI